MPELPAGHAVGRYVLYDEIASGGMATVHLGRLIGPAGFSRVVAVKRLHPAYARDPSFVLMLLDEARLASRIGHPNVAAILDVVAAQGELLLVMDYVPGETLARLMRAAKRAGERVPHDIAVAIIIDVLRGLHAAHEARGADGEPLGIVHRDVSPQNVLVATDGTARLLDFGVAKAISRAQSTADGQLKGKLGYISPEQLGSGEVDRRADVFAAAVVAWESIALKRLFSGDDLGSVLANIVSSKIPFLRDCVPDVPEGLARTIAQGLERDLERRIQTAEEMASDLEQAQRPARRERVAAWVKRLAGEVLARRQETIRRIETSSGEHGVVQVAVDLASADESGRLPTLRTTLTGVPMVGAPEEQGTFASAQATRSVSPPAPRTSRRKRAVLFGLAVAASGVLLALLWTRKAALTGPAERALAVQPPQPAPAEPPTAQPAASATEPAASATEPAASATEPAPSVTASAAVSSARALPPNRHPRRPATRPSAKSSAAEAAAAAKPAPTPVDPLVDQR